MPNILEIGTTADVSADIVAVESTPVTLSYIGAAGGALIIDRKGSDGVYYASHDLTHNNSPINFRGNSTIRVRRPAGNLAYGCDRD